MLCHITLRCVLSLRCIVGRGPWAVGRGPWAVGRAVQAAVSGCTCSLDGARQFYKKEKFLRARPATAGHNRPHGPAFDGDKWRQVTSHLHMRNFEQVLMLRQSCPQLRSESVATYLPYSSAMRRDLNGIARPVSPPPHKRGIAHVGRYARSPSPVLTTPVRWAESADSPRAASFASSARTEPADGAEHEDCALSARRQRQAAATPSTAPSALESSMATTRAETPAAASPNEGARVRRRLETALRATAEPSIEPSAGDAAAADPVQPWLRGCGDVPEEVLRKIHARLQAASYHIGGQDWALLFRSIDKNRQAAAITRRASLGAGRGLPMPRKKKQVGIAGLG